MRHQPTFACLAILAWSITVAPGATPVVSHLTAVQRSGTKLVDISYDVTADTPTVIVSLEISSDGGTTFSVPVATGSGTIGAEVTTGTGKTIAWDAGANWIGQYSTRMRFKVTVNDDFSLIPAGAFTMGDSLDGLSDAPTRTVTLSAFFMGRQEVTKAEWDAVRTWAVSHGYTDLAVGAGKATNHPVQTVSWWDGIKWCNARSEKEGLTPCYTVGGSVMKTGTTVPTVNWTANGYRLPTEAEWEKAARGGLSGKRFPWGNTISHTQANFYNVGGETYQTGTTGYHPSYGTGNTPYTSPVGSFIANDYGLQDMTGNVWEWCWDWYGTYASGAQTDPRGEPSGSSRVARGGCWSNPANYCRVAHRSKAYPGGTGIYLGFRLARSSALGGGSGFAITADVVVDTRYELTTVTPTNGTISGVAVDGKYLTGTTATLTAVPAPGYAFTGWTGAASGTSNPVSLPMDADKTIGATFTRQYYILSASAISNGTIGGIVAGGNYLPGTTATLTAVPAALYGFTGWTGAVSGTANPLTMLMDADKTIGANFTRQYTLSLGAVSNGTISGVAVDGKYLTGTMATLTAVPAAGYAFTGWTGAASGKVNPLSLLMNGNQTIGANFTRQYVLTANAVSGGTISGIAVDGKYLTGTIVTLTAVPSDGYVFTAWTGTASGTANPVYVRMDADKTIGATFTRQYTLAASAVSNGSISGIAWDTKYLTGTTATLTAVAVAGYVFTGWTGAASGTANPLSLLMDADKTIGANFTRQYTLSRGTATNGTISGIVAGGKYLTGTTAELTAVPNPGYVFTGWTGGASGTANPLSLLMNTDKTIGANYTQLYTLSLGAVSNGTISGIAVDGNYLPGTTATLTAVPAAGYSFTGWTGDVWGTANPFSVLMNSSKTIHAGFVEDHTGPVVSKVTFAQRAGTKLVDITYDVTSGTPSVFVSLAISNDGGTTFSVPATTVTGAIGAGVASGTGKIITWDAGADWIGQYSDRMRFSVTAIDASGMTLIPAGAFTMGDSFSEADIFERPTRTVTLSAFYIGQKEVTKAEWDAVRYWAVGHGYTFLGEGDGLAPGHPVHTVFWWDVIKWCNARSEAEGLTPCYTVGGAVMKTGTTVPTVNWAATGYRLPTEAEWEKAARGGLSGKRFPWGNTISHTAANFYNGGGETYQAGTTGYHPSYDTGNTPYTSPVGSFIANGYGLQDMSGNVWELCWDWWGAYASGAQTDPRGAASGFSHVIRGGCWHYDASSARCARRTSESPNFVSATVGFRLARGQQ